MQDGVERLGYAVGLEAVKAVQKQESMLWKVSEVLTAPMEKVDKTAEKLVKELKDANVEKRQANQGTGGERRRSWASESN